MPIEPQQPLKTRTKTMAEFHEEANKDLKKVHHPLIAERIKTTLQKSPLKCWRDAEPVTVEPEKGLEIRTIRIFGYAIFLQMLNEQKTLLVLSVLKSGYMLYGLPPK